MHKNMRYLSAGFLWRQQGAATLLMSLVLLLSTTIVTFTTARTGLMEQHISNNEYRAKEVHQAAEAGLEYGIAWLADNPWSNGDPPPAAPSITASAHTYEITLTFTENSGYIQVTSVAQSAADASITATVLQYIRQRDPVLNPDALIGPPLALKGCLTGATGNPDIYPSNYDFPSAGVAVATSQTDDGSGNDCIDWGHIDPHGGSIESNAFTGRAWDQIFNISKADFQALAQAEIDAGVAYADRRYHWITSGSPFHSSLGSPAHPVVLVFAAAANCPKINGGPTIHGIVFIDGDCVANGWGGTTVYGSVIVEGDVSKINANTQLWDFSNIGGWDWSQVNKPRGTNKILGTWKDF